ncbi:NADH-quinone oxidoreductase subunit 8 [Phycisphaerae bacterium RAS1]|nr:NADH-quinone oxidoreductase subunit 8 [Phycisphaerae bacterium RAS1]
MPDKNADPLSQKIERILGDWRVYVALGAGGGIATVVLAAAVWYFFSDAIKWALANQFAFSLIMLVVVLNVIVNGCALCILAERKIASWMQDRMGPNRVGFWGLLQPLADGLKFLLKEDIIPGNVDKPLFILAPALALTISLLTFSVIPWAGVVHFPWMEAGKTVTTQVASIDIGVLYLLALGSLGVYGVVLAGYASNNKYAFYGGMRATAQMLSYEVPLGLGLLVMILTCGSLRLENMVDAQASGGVWYVFYHPIAFMLVLISAFAETNRTPFDLAEAEQELVGGYHTEYSAMKFALFFLAEYAHMVVNSALLTAVFFGGWHIWFGPNVNDTSWVAMLIKFAIFWAKVMVLLGFYMAIRWTIPRFRFDQLMRLAWKGLVPMGMAAVVATGLLTAFGLQKVWWISLIANVVLIAAAMAIGAFLKAPITGRQESMTPQEMVIGAAR